MGKQFTALDAQQWAFIEKLIKNFLPLERGIARECRHKM